jgi:hypothetical protein
MKCPGCKVDNCVAELNKHHNAMTVLTARSAIEKYLMGRERPEIITALQACVTHRNELGLDLTHSRISDFLSDNAGVRIPTITADQGMAISQLRNRLQEKSRGSAR